MGLLVVLVGLVPLADGLLDRRDQLLTTNTRSPLSATTTDVRPGGRECANVRDDELLKLPKGTSAVRLYVGYDGRTAPRLRIALSGGGTTVEGASPRTYRDGSLVVLPLEHELDRDLQRICVRNDGPVPAELARAVDASGNDRPILNGRVSDEREPEAAPKSTVRFDLVGRRNALAASLLSGGLDHATAFKPDGVGPVVIGAGLVLVLLLGVSGLVFVLREPGDEDGSAGRVVPASGPPARDGDDPHERSATPAADDPAATPGAPSSATPVPRGDDGRGGW